MLKKLSDDWKWRNTIRICAKGILIRTNRDWRIAQASKGNNDLYYRLRRQYGDNYMNEFKEVREHALKEFKSACEEVEKARADYEKVIKN